MLELSLATEYQGFTPKQIKKFVYLKPRKFTWLEGIPELLEEIENPKREYQDSAFPETLTEELNQPETWESFYQKAPLWKQRTVSLKTFWEKQKNFVLCSNEYLLQALNAILELLEQIREALRELKKYFFQLPEIFAFRYANYLKELHDHIQATKTSLVYAMFARLKTSYLQSTLALHKQNHVDDVLYYVIDQLQVLGVIDKPELKSLKPRATLNEYFYTAFYDAVKRYGHTEEVQHYADIFHWSNQFNKLVLPTPKKKRFELSDINSTSNSMMLVSNHHTKIAIPGMLKKHIPPNRRFPAWFFWEEHKILDFWQKQQSFLYKLHECYSKIHATQPPQSLNALQNYQILLESEEQNLMKIELPLFAFTFKSMIKDWKACLNDLYQNSFQQQKILEANIRRQAFVKSEDSKNNLESQKNENLMPFESQLQQWQKKNITTVSTTKLWHTRRGGTFYVSSSSKDKYKHKQSPKTDNIQSSQIDKTHVSNSPIF